MIVDQKFHDEYENRFEEICCHCFINFGAKIKGNIQKTNSFNEKNHFLWKIVFFEPHFLTLSNIDAPFAKKVAINNIPKKYVIFAG